MHKINQNLLIYWLFFDWRETCISDLTGKFHDQPAIFTDTFKRGNRVCNNRNNREKEIEKKGWTKCEAYQLSELAKPRWESTQIDRCGV